MNPQLKDIFKQYVLSKRQQDVDPSVPWWDERGVTFQYNYEDINSYATEVHQMYDGKRYVINYKNTSPDDTAIQIDVFVPPDLAEKIPLNLWTKEASLLDCVMVWKISINGTQEPDITESMFIHPVVNNLGAVVEKAIKVFKKKHTEPKYAAIGPHNITLVQDEQQFTSDDFSKVAKDVLKFIKPDRAIEQTHVELHVEI